MACDKYPTSAQRVSEATPPGWHRTHKQSNTTARIMHNGCGGAVVFRECGTKSLNFWCLICKVNIQLLHVTLKCSSLLIVRCKFESNVKFPLKRKIIHLHHQSEGVILQTEKLYLFSDEEFRFP